MLQEAAKERMELESQTLCELFSRGFLSNKSNLSLETEFQVDPRRKSRNEKWRRVERTSDYGCA
jgi:hypothetical protein